MKFLTQLSPGVRQYLLVTGNYWAFTLTDGALRIVDSTLGNGGPGAVEYRQRP